MARWTMRARRRAQAIVGGCCMLALVGGALAAWIQHLYTCFTTQAWGFLIAGAIAPPIGIIHGVGVWLGAWG